MKGKYFFKENGKEIEIKDFDYKYVLNSLLKEFDRTANRKYMYTIVINREYDSLGNPVFDVRTLYLNDIYFDSTNLTAMELMEDDIRMKGRDLKIENLPMPPLQREYNDWKEGKIQRKTAEVALPEFTPIQRKEISSDDNRIFDIMEMVSGKDKENKSLIVLDWIENFPIVSNEITQLINNVSTSQFSLSTSLNSHSEYLHTIYNNLRDVLDEIFSVNPNFIKKFFGKTELKVDKNLDLSMVLNKLNQAVSFDSSRFDGVNEQIKNLNTKLNEIQDNISLGAVACEFQIQKVSEPFEWEIRSERLQKMLIANDLTRGSIMSVHNEFIVNVSKIHEIQTVLIPMIMVRLQECVGKKIDPETEEMIRNLAKKKK